MSMLTVGTLPLLSPDPPANLRILRRSTGPSLNALLIAYGFDTSWTVEARRIRLLRHIGVNELKRWTEEGGVLGFRVPASVWFKPTSPLSLRRRVIGNILHRVGQALTPNGVVLEEAMHFPLNVRVMFQPNSVTSARNMELLAGHIADRIGLQWYAPVGLWLSAREEAIPIRVYVMAVLVVILKILYKLDGRSRGAEGNTRTNEGADRKHQDAPRSSKSGLNKAGKGKGKEESRSCHEWPARQMLEKLETIQQSADMFESEKDLAAYIKYCQDVIFPSTDLAYDAQKFQTRFRRIFERLPKQKPREDLGASGDRSGSKEVEAILEPSDSMGTWCSHESSNLGLCDIGKEEILESPEDAKSGKLEDARQVIECLGKKDAVVGNCLTDVCKVWQSGRCTPGF